MLSRILLAFFLFLVITASCLGQENKEDTPEARPAKAAEKLDEFGDIPASEFAPKLKKFIDVIGNSIGYVVFYHGYNADPFKNDRYYADRRKRGIFQYLSGRCTDGARILMIDGPTLAEMKTELWIGAPGGERPKIETAGELIKPRITSTKVDAMPAFIAGKEIDLSEALIGPEVNSDDPDGETALFPRRRDELDLSFRFLNTLKENSGRLIFYLDETIYDLQKSRALIEKRLLTEAGPAVSKRVKIIYGGYREQPEAEVWDVLPHGIEPEPVPDEKIP